MADINSTLNTKEDPGQTGDKQWDTKSLLQKVLELQDLLLQVQEKNLILSAQARELERAARDTEDLKAEVSAQNLILADKARENKTLHQEFSRLTSLVDARQQEVDELKTAIREIELQLKTKEQERDILLAMLNQAEEAQKKTLTELTKSQQLRQAKESKEMKGIEQKPNSNWLRHIIHRDS